MLSSALEDTLRLFGKERFRPMQRDLVECALEGRSCIGILPTGSGKSLCYQIPAVLGNGLTVVVSPLIALMRDQVAGLEKLGVAAARYDSTLAEEDKVALMDRLKSGGVRLLFAAPESLESRGFSRSWSLFPPACSWWMRLIAFRNGGTVSVRIIWGCPFFSESTGSAASWR